MDGLDITCYNITTMLLGVAESARKMRKELKMDMNTRKLYRHIFEYKTCFVDVPQIRILWDDITGKPVKNKQI